MINFEKAQRFGLFFFIALFFIFIGTYVYKYKTRGQAFTYSIDFTGGTQVQFSFSKPLTADGVTFALAQENFHNVIIREFSAQEMIVRVQEFSENVAPTAEKMRKAIESHTEALVEIRQTDSVGAGIGATYWWNALLAIAACLLVMLSYIFIRFCYFGFNMKWSFGFAMGAIGSLFHDALLIMTFCLLCDYEISVNIITAIIIVLGYSINDTIIIFARIRENIHARRSTPLATIITSSIQDTLRRTLLTTISTLLVVVSLMIFGGGILSTLSTALFVGILFGTYSSICVASPIMLFFNRAASTR